MKNTPFTNIYTLSNPINNEVRYLGKTISLKERYSKHKRKKNNTHKDCWVASLNNSGVLPKMEVIDVVPTDEWEFWETWWIQLLKSWNFNLTNILSGGAGTFGYNHTADTKKKISNRSKRLWDNAEYRDKMKIVNGGRNNAIADKNIYHFWHPVHGELHIESSELGRKFNLKSVSIRRIVKGQRLQYKGWRLFKNKEVDCRFNHMNQTIYSFTHPHHGERLYRKIDLVNEFGLSPSSISHLISGRFHTTKGWKIATKVNGKTVYSPYKKAL